MLATLMAAFLLAGCSARSAVIDHLATPALRVAGVDVDVQEVLDLYRATYQFDQRPDGTPQAIAEFYLRQYQPGPLPRVFQSSYIYDRRGQLLAELFDEGRRTWVPLDRISSNLLDAVIATEDASFYLNRGFDVRRLTGAALQNLVSGSTLGGSTITMQLARNLFLPPNERFSRTVDRKLVEFLLARDLDRLFTKDEILEMYLNLAYFGHRAYGPEAAARTYFGKSALSLSLAEATLLAGLPQQPANLDPMYNLEGAKQRQRIVLDLMVRHGYLEQAEADEVFQQPVALAPDPDQRPNLAPHFLQYLSAYVARPPDNQNLQRSGLRVYTTLDTAMQNLAQQVVREQVDALRSRYDLNNAALLALKTGTDEILAMVGSADFEQRRDRWPGECDRARAPAGQRHQAGGLCQRHRAQPGQSGDGVVGHCRAISDQWRRGIRAPKL